MKSYTGSRDIAPLIRNLGTDAGLWSTSSAGHFCPRNGPPCPLNWRLRGFRSQFGLSGEEKISGLCRDSNRGSSSQQPSHYTGYSVPAGEESQLWILSSRRFLQLPVTSTLLGPFFPLSTRFSCTLNICFFYYFIACSITVSNTTCLWTGCLFND